MKLVDALRILNQQPAQSALSRDVALICGFVPLHLKTFMSAHLRLDHPSRCFSVTGGFYGDIIGGLQSAAISPPDSAAVIVEWPDLDPRLSLRNSGSWEREVIREITENATETIKRIKEPLMKVAERNPVALCAPTLPLSPLASNGGYRASNLEIQLEHAVTTLLDWSSDQPRIHLISPQRLASVSPHSERYSLQMDLIAGFPYSRSHADCLASAICSVLYPAPPKKGIISDLDDTMWAGILGEVGIHGVGWSLLEYGQLHAIYQQLLTLFAESGVLIAVATKNDPGLVQEAFKRPDILIDGNSVFPIEASWQPKSIGIERILKSWNLAADSVVFVDDNPLELAEVKAHYPDMQCVQFPKTDADAAWKFFWKLRDFFGQDGGTEEDLLRVATIRASTQMQQQDPAISDTDFLRKLGGKITLDFRKPATDPRPLQLVNKTNQFNLNGRRFTEAEWAGALSRPESFLCVGSYADKFGPLGKIAVILGDRRQEALYVHTAVLSCRAFSRRIEHQIIGYLFDRYNTSHILFDYAVTERNRPITDFLAAMSGMTPTVSPLELSQDMFLKRCPTMPHVIEEVQ